MNNSKTSRTKIQIIGQDKDIIVINKPAGVSVTKDRSGGDELPVVLGDQLRPQMCSKLRLVHRLDKETSGVMILAKTTEAQRKFTSCFENRLIKKTYLALVSGLIRQRRGTINAPLARCRKNTQLMCIDRKRGKEAVTDWELLADFGTIKLLAVYPITGRTHQIRVHLASIELGPAIDALYGNRRALFLSDFKTDYRLAKGQKEKPLIERLTLHAYQLQLPDPQADRPVSFVARLDRKFATTIKMLTKHNPKGLGAFLKPEHFTNILNANSLY